MHHCPAQRKSSAFYLIPLKKPKLDAWFAQSPVGHNTLDRTVKRLCVAAGIPGFKTNHSLRVTNATQLFQSGVDEQLVMGSTGHRSIDGVRTYKRISETQECEVPSILNAVTNGSKKEKLEAKHSTSPAAARTEPPALHFTGCSGITINYINQ